MASKYWIKLYHEILQDPKMGRLPDHLWRRCIEFFLVAGEFEQDGYLPPIKDMAWELRATSEEVEQSLIALSECGIVALVDDRWLVVKFAERQAPVNSTERSKMSRKFNKEVQRNVAEEATENKPSRQRTTWMTEIYRDLPATAGIYAIKCAGSGMGYIGGSINIQHRIRAHLSEMSIFPNHKMYKDLKEFGPESISVQILETVKDETKLREKEVYWINQYPFDSLYNTESTGKRNRYWPDNNLQRNVAPDTDTDTDTDTDIKILPPDKKSISKVIPKEPTLPYRILFVALAELCRINLKAATQKQVGQLNVSSKALVKLITDTDQFKAKFPDYWDKIDWRGQKGQPPTPPQIQEVYGDFCHWVDNPAAYQPSRNGANQNGTHQKPTKPTGATLAGEPVFDKYTREIVYPDGTRVPAVSDLP